MSDMNKSTKEAKLEVQMRLFTEQMSFMLEKDQRINNNAKAAQENAKLAIEKEEELIRCLANISVVLGRGLGVGSEGVPPPGTTHMICKAEARICAQ
jgi:hypothetical protein